MPLPIQQLAALGAKIGFDLVRGEGGATEEVTFHLGGGGGAYDPAADAEAPGEPTDAVVNAIAYRRKEAQGGVGQETPRTQFSLQTETLLVEQAEIGAGAVIREADTVTRSDGSEWNIVAAVRDPGRSVWIVDIRK